MTKKIVLSVLFLSIFVFAASVIAAPVNKRARTPKLVKSGVRYVQTRKNYANTTIMPIPASYLEVFPGPTIQEQGGALISSKTSTGFSNASKQGVLRSSAINNSDKTLGKDYTYTTAAIKSNYFEVPDINVINKTKIKVAIDYMCTKSISKNGGEKSIIVDGVNVISGAVLQRQTIHPSASNNYKTSTLDFVPVGGLKSGTYRMRISTAARADEKNSSADIEVKLKKITVSLK
ncbi:MAG: hypothetical protein ABIA67_01945 [Candidatus Margulisiibacteriota bacterium]